MISQPALCPRCFELMVSEAARTRFAQATYCPHNATIAQASVDPAGVVAELTLRGPVTRAQASALLRAITGNAPASVAVRKAN